MAVVASPRPVMGVHDPGDRRLGDSWLVRFTERLGPHGRRAGALLRHRRLVAYAGRALGVSWWRRATHDWSKLLPDEWWDAVGSFRARPRPRNPLLRNRHYVRNRHHWQHWVIWTDTGPAVILPMPEDDVREMVADWAAACYQMTGAWDVRTWHATHTATILLHPTTMMTCERLFNTRIN